MKFLCSGLAASILLFGVVAADAQTAPITCSELPQAAAFVGNLKPGPNTRAAERHLDAARNAKSDDQCAAELRQVDVYARRSMAADKRLASGHPAPAHRRVLCADAMHQDRPGGTDYHGPAVSGCPRPRI